MKMLNAQLYDHERIEKKNYYAIEHRFTLQKKVKG